MTVKNSFDDLVGTGEQQLRHAQAQRLGSLQIDHQLELGWLLDRQIRRLLPVEIISRRKRPLCN